ncbi:MAG: T9SS type A sorting domain-containing protein [Paludibacteraceae bacterium]|nr:T9SS type A sorting domain-containing protein [Paludibacteraceae bacterium]
MKQSLLILPSLAMAISVNAEISGKFEIDKTAEVFKISPYLFGRNTSDIPYQSGKTLSQEFATQLRESGIKFVRLNNGNNATKYNYRKHLTVHPDWYSNVYECDWDKSSDIMAEEFPEIQGMYSFQLCGYTASNNEHNFNDWEYNKSQWGKWCSWPLCGGGEVINADADEYKAGDINLYLEKTSIEQTTDILTYWKDTLKKDMSQFLYWNMDNEPEMWGWTHKDVHPDFDPDFYVEQYIKAAVAARKKFPDIKFCGPVAGSEWTWYATSGKTKTFPKWEGKQMPWLEYFIMRVGQEQKKLGIRLLDVLDIHYYPSSSLSVDEVLQSHRTYFDREYKNPEANGVYTINGGWDTNIKEEYILGRCSDWMDKYIGKDHGITFSVSEFNIASSHNASIQAVAYASHLGELMKHGGEFFTPWSWYPGMWETAHIFGRYTEEYYVPSKLISGNIVESYITRNADATKYSIITLNRSQKESAKISLSDLGLDLDKADINAYSLANLPSTETFKSHTDNALENDTYDSKNASIDVKPMSISVLTIDLSKSSKCEDADNSDIFITSNGNRQIEIFADNFESVEIANISGSIVAKSNDKVVNISSPGVYLVKVICDGNTNVSKIVVR